jgi:molybdate transport system ATP-binding protein
VSGLEVHGSAVVGSLNLQVALVVEPGETLAVLGPNGAGKTTLLSVVAGLRGLDTGTVSLGGRVLDDPAAGRWVGPEGRSIGVVFQDLLLFPHLDVLDNVAFGLRASGTGRDEARRVALEWLERLEVSQLASARPARLSGGEAQRVALARALAPRPAALVLDEPLSALDADVRASVRRALRDHLGDQPGPRVVVTHDPLDAAVLADRVVVLEAGSVTAAGSLADLVARPRTRWAAELAGTNLIGARGVGTRLELAGGGSLSAAEPGAQGDVLVAVRPSAVALHASHPTGSPRNVWPATVADIEGFGERVRVRLVGAVPIVAEVTAAAALELALAPGAAVWASVKATDLVVYPA